MEYKQILFNESMVCKILERKKLQTRRIIKPQPDSDIPVRKVPFYSELEKDCGKYCVTKPDGESLLVTPKYQVGDIMWVRETWQKTNTGYVYRADSTNDKQIHKWRPNIHMPKPACRIFLKVTNVEPQRLQDISADEIKAEGVSWTIDHYPNLMQLWEELWVSVYGIDSWRSNPYVWAYTFEVTKSLHKF